MRCVECVEAKKERVKEAKWLLIDDTVHHQIRPLCDEHLEPYREHFGEDMLDYFSVESPMQIIEGVNKKFDWYEAMLKRLYAEIDKVKKVAKLDWIPR